MTVEAVPAFEQGSTYGAEVVRHALGTFLQRGSAIGSIQGGIVGNGDCQVAAGSGMQVLVSPGEVWVSGSSVSTQGGYLGRVTSSTALSIAASNSSNPRVETIVAQVKDKAYSGTEETFAVAVVTGTAEAGATLANKKGAGSVPASSMVLAYVLVPAKASSIEAGNIVNVTSLVRYSASLVPRNVGAANPIVLTPGEFAETESASEAILPNPATSGDGAECGLLKYGAGTTIAVKCPTAYIDAYGTTLSSGTALTVYALQPVRFITDGANWVVIGDGGAVSPSSIGAFSGSVSMTAGTEYVLSPLRPALASIVVKASNTSGTVAKIKVGSIAAVEVAFAGSEVQANTKSAQTVLVPVPPGQALLPTTLTNCIAVYFPLVC